MGSGTVHFGTINYIIHEEFFCSLISMLLVLRVFLGIHAGYIGWSEARSCPNTLKLDWSDNEKGFAHDYTLSIVDFNQRVRSFVESNSRPPLKEAYLMHRVPDHIHEDIMAICPEVLVVAELIVAEAELFTGSHPSTSERFGRTWSVMSQLSPVDLREISEVWFVGELVSKFNRQLAVMGDLGSARTVDFVVCHCREDLGWLVGSWSANISSGNTRLFIYEKCGMNSTGIPNPFGSMTVIHQRDGPVRGDECTAYLDYIVVNYDNNLPDFTVFLQADPDRHMFLSYLSTALAGISSGGYSVPFLHLNFHRHYQTSTPCMRDVEQLIFSSSPSADLIGTYCCAQFIVSRDRIRRHGREFYRNALSLVDGSVADVCSPEPPRRSSHCYVLEYLWHVIFGEDRVLPFKADDQRLPSILRMKFGNENMKRRWDDVELEKNDFDRKINKTVEIF